MLFVGFHTFSEMLQYFLVQKKETKVKIRQNSLVFGRFSGFLYLRVLFLRVPA